MISVPINLTEQEFQRLNALYPPTAKSSNVGGRSVELVQFYFRTIDPQCQFRVPNDGTDLVVTTGGATIQIEIKGTADTDIAWSKLKVSGNPSHQQLLNDVPLYRVVAVYDRAPTIHILKHSEDFEMNPEPRWSVKKRQ